MPQLGEAYVIINAALEPLERGLALAHHKTITSMKAITADLTPMQERIGKQFMPLPAGFSVQIEKQFDVRSRLEEEYYEATASRKDMALRDTGRYYDNLRNQFQDHQGTLTLIDKTETAKRTQILKEYATGFRGIQRSMAVFMRAGFFAYMAAGAVDVTASIIKLRKEGESLADSFARAFESFAAGLPILGRVYKSFENLGDAIWGAKAATEEFQKSQKGVEAFGGLNKELTRSIKLLNAPIEERGALSVYFEYMDNLEKIAKAKGEGLIIRGQESLLRKKAMTKWGLSIEAARIEPINEMIESLTKQADVFGMNSVKIALYEAALKKASDEEMAAIEVQANRIYQLEESARSLKEYEGEMKSFMKTVKESLKTPAQEIEELWNKVFAAFERGFLKAGEALNYISKGIANILKEADPKLYSFIESLKEMIKTPAEKFTEINDMIIKALGRREITEKQADIARGLYRKQIFGAEPTARIGFVGIREAWQRMAEAIAIKKAETGEKTNKLLGHSNDYLKNIADNTEDLDELGMIGE